MPFLFFLDGIIQGHAVHFLKRRHFLTAFIIHGCCCVTSPTEILPDYKCNIPAPWLKCPFDFYTQFHPTDECFPLYEVYKTSCMPMVRVHISQLISPHRSNHNRIHLFQDSTQLSSSCTLTLEDSWVFYRGRARSTLALLSTSYDWVNSRLRISSKKKDKENLQSQWWVANSSILQLYPAKTRLYPPAFINSYTLDLTVSRGPGGTMKIMNFLIVFPLLWTFTPTTTAPALKLHCNFWEKK